MQVVCSSDFSRELEQFATKVAPTNTQNYIFNLDASARKQDVKSPGNVLAYCISTNNAVRPRCMFSNICESLSPTICCSSFKV